MRILIVEDQEDVRALTVLILEMAGHFVFPAASAREAEDTWLQGEFDILVTDQCLGGDSITGVELIERISAVSPRAHFVLLSGDYVDMHLSDPRVRFLKKPFGRVELLSCLTGATGTSESK